MAEKNSRKVIKYRRTPKSVLIIACAVLVYTISFVVMYLSKSKIRSYEVEVGNLTANATFTGIALRSEKVCNSEYSGNINYYQREGSRVKNGDTLYTVDETGRVAEILSQYSKADENSLSKSSLALIKTTLNNFKTSYDGSNFGNVYDMKTDLNSTILESMNQNIINNMESIIQSTGSGNLFRTINATEGGIVVYAVDGYESKSESDINSSSFDKKSYAKNNLKSDELIVSGNPAYKLITSENWNVYIPLTDDDIKENDLSSKNTITIKFKKDGITTQGKFSIITNNGNTYGKISLDKYVIRYATERLLDIEIVSTGKTGLKIPISALTDSEFYTVPVEYLTTGPNKEIGFMCESYDDNKQVVSKFIEAEVYKKTDTLCYIRKSDFNVSDVITMPDDVSKRYIVGTVEKLKGVYCINTGYTVFRVVDIIEQNNEYCVVKKDTTHGVSVYDHIILDAEKYSENQMIY